MICWREALEKWTPQVDTHQQITSFQDDFFPLIDATIKTHNEVDE